MSAGQLSRLRLPSVRVPGMPERQVVRRRLIAAALILAIAAAGYMLWFRDSSFVRVSDVEVVGADDNAAVAAALESAADGQSTLHLDVDALRAAVASDPAVAGLTADADFPHGVTINVDVRQPVAYLDGGGGAILSADGTVLQSGVDKPEGLPSIDAETNSTGDRVDGDALIGTQVLGGLQPVLAPQVESVSIDRELGPVVTLNGGVEVRFGDSSRPEMKWKAVAAVLANPSVTSVNYLDVSVPTRPVTG